MCGVYGLHASCFGSELWGEQDSLSSQVLDCTNRGGRRSQLKTRDSGAVLFDEGTRASKWKSQGKKAVRGRDMRRLGCCPVKWQTWAG